MTMRQELSEIIKQYGLKQGHFTASDGTPTNRYYDIKAVTTHPRGGELLSVLCGLQLLEWSDPDKRIEAIGGLEGGAEIITAAINREESVYYGLPLPVFEVVRPTWATAKQGPVMNAPSPGSRVLIVDDVAVTGRSLLQSVIAVKAIRCEVAGILVLIDRNPALREQIESAGFRYASIFTDDEIVGGSVAAPMSLCS